MKNARAIDVADGFVKEFICIYGAPKALLTDQGPHFINSLLKFIARKFRINSFKTTAYRPQSNGSVERSHHVIWEYLKVYVKNNDWDEYLRLRILRIAYTKVPRYIPYELVFGRLVKLSTADPSSDDLTTESYTEYLKSVFNKIKDTEYKATKSSECQGTI